jgi:glycosyltransferase involved in cell wall biosynthesis
MTPELSIIIISWNLQDHNCQAIESAFAQDLASCEIIVVDNGSSDASVERICAYKSTKTHTYRVILNSENLGPGLARNQGMAKAKGEYFAFLDGDDWLEPQALPAMLAMTREHKADITVFNHRQIFFNGKIRENCHTNLLHSGDRSTPSARQDLLRNFNVVWNKIYRREFVSEQGLKLSDGIYEDVDWTHKALMLASRVAASDQVVVNYRKDRIGSITNTQSSDHMHAIDRFRALLDFAEANKELCAPYRQHIFERVIRNTLTLLSGKQSRLPSKLRPIFFHRVQELLNTYDPGNLIKVRNANALVYRTLRSGSFPTFNMVKRLNGLRWPR